MAKEQSPGEKEIARVLGGIEHPFLRFFAQEIDRDPRSHFMATIDVKEASDLLSTDDLNYIDSLLDAEKSNLLLEAAALAAECQEAPSILVPLLVMRIYSDCIARHLMRSSMSLDDKSAARLIASYGRRLASEAWLPAFSFDPNDVNHQRDGVQLFARTVAPWVRRKKFLLRGDSESLIAFRRLIAIAEIEKLEDESMVLLRAVLESEDDIPAPAVHVRPVTKPVQEVEGSLTDEQIKARMDALMSPCIWWHRTQPVHVRRDITSYIGGLPRLAPELVWPRTRKDGKALPLAVQIDCSQIPSFTGGELLPRTGTLYFFVNPRVEDPRDDIWGHVLYSPKRTREIAISVPPRDPRLLFELTYGEYSWIDPRTMLDLVPTQFEQWAIEPLPMASHSRLAHLPIYHELYRGPDQNKASAASQRIESISAAINKRAVEKALGRPVPSDSRPRHEDLRKTDYPWTWLFVLMHASALRRYAIRCADELRDPAYRVRYPAEHIAALATIFPVIAGEAADWVARARGHAADMPVSPNHRNAFHTWIASIGARLKFAMDAGWLPLHPFISINSADEGARILIAANSRASELIPASYLDEAKYLADYGFFGRHQMLGHRKGNGDPVADHILLMQLDTDYGINWLWGDCHTLGFWIKPSDLAARRFKDVKVILTW